MDFRLRQLQCFLTLAELLNYGKTARALYMSQPTITFQIKSLEESFGVRLFDRDRQQVRLTDAGYAFREYAQTIMDTVGAARHRLTDLHTRLRLRISCGPVGQFLLLPHVLRMLAARFPEFELDVCELSTEQQMTELGEGKLDALLMVGSLPVAETRFDLICKESMVAVLSREDPVCRSGSISVEDLRTRSILVTAGGNGRYDQTFIQGMLAPFGVEPTFIEAPHSSSMQLAYAAAGEGVVLTLASMAQRVFPGVVTLPFRERLPEVEMGLLSTHAKNTRAMEVFREVVLESAKAHLEAMRHPVYVDPHTLPAVQEEYADRVEAS